MSAAGLGDDTFVVTYDDHHVPVAARVWWALRSYDHDAVAVLDGGITRWTAEGRPLSNETPTFAPATFTPRLRADRYATKQDVLDAVQAGSAALLDARMDKAYASASGHIPGARRLTGLGFLRDGERWMEPPDAKARIEELGLEPDAPVIAYCGGGVARDRHRARLRPCGPARAAAVRRLLDRMVRRPRHPEGCALMKAVH